MWVVLSHTWTQYRRATGLSEVQAHSAVNERKITTYFTRVVSDKVFHVKFGPGMRAATEVEKQHGVNKIRQP